MLLDILIKKNKAIFEFNIFNLYIVKNMLVLKMIMLLLSMM
jgi:hypothetical protein